MLAIFIIIIDKITLFDYLINLINNTLILLFFIFLFFIIYLLLKDDYLIFNYYI